MIERIELQTERLRIRHYEASDLQNCHRFRREVFGLAGAPQAAERWLRWTIDSYRELAQLGQPPYADYALERNTTGEFLGSVGIVPTVIPWGALAGDTEDNRLSPEIGLFWGILPAHQRRGYASEAGKALIDFLFDVFRARQVVATTEFENIASQKTMKRLGMTLHRNPASEPSWCQIVGKLANPR